MTDLRKDTQIQQAIVVFWMATTRPAQYEALATALAAAMRLEEPA